MSQLAADVLSRSAASIVGLFLLVATTVSLMRTVVIPRSLRSVISDTVARVVNATANGLARLRKDYYARDAVLAWAGPTIILLQLITWLVMYLLAFGLLLYGIGGQDLGDSIRQAGSSLFTLGFAAVNTEDQTIIDFFAAATGPIVIALMIGFLPTIYSAYLEREVDVTTLSVAAGEPAWGPELLSRYALSDNLLGITDEFLKWGAAASRLRMTHVTYPVLIRVRSAQALRHYAVALLAVMDAAALQVSLNHSLAKSGAYRLLIQGGQSFEVLYVVVSQRRSLRSRIGFHGAFRASRPAVEQAGADLPGWTRKMIAVELATDRDAMTGLNADAVNTLSRGERGALRITRADFDQAVDILQRSGFPIDRALDEAWEQFQAARSRYEFAALELCRILDATPAPWSGDRRIPTPTIWPNRAVDLLPEAVDILDEATNTTPAPTAEPTAETAADPTSEAEKPTPDGKSS